MCYAQRRRGCSQAETLFHREGWSCTKKGYQRVIQSDVDVVLLARPPHFRPLHLQACVDAGKHIFAEKPAAVERAGGQEGAGRL